jgi:hypothetical protein
MMFDFEERDITPATTNHDLEGSGHTYITGLREFIDNAIDSGSKIVKVFLDKDENKKPILVIVDQGTGFKDVTQGLGVYDLHLMVTKNYSTKDRPTSKNPNGNEYLGRYGNGIKNALAKLTDSKHATIMSAEKDSAVYVVEYNQKVIQQTGVYSCQVRPIKYLKSQNDELRTTWLKYMTLEDASIAESGTVVILRGLKPEVLATLKKGMSKVYKTKKHSLAVKLGETYHRFIEKGLEIKIGLTPESLIAIESEPPTLGLQPKETKEFTIAGLPVVVNMYIIPQFGFTTEKVHLRPKTNVHQGVYVYRGDRLHLSIDEKPMNLAVSPDALIAYNQNKVDIDGKKKRHSDPDTMNPMVYTESHCRFNHIRFTLEFPPALDAYFNVNTIKTEIGLQNDAFVELGEYLKKTVINNDAYHSGYKQPRRTTPKTVVTTTKVAKKPNSLSVGWNDLVKFHGDEMRAFKINLLETSKPEERTTVENTLSLYSCFLGKEV